MQNIRLKSSCTWTFQTTYSLRLDAKNTAWQMHALLKEKSVLVCSFFAPEPSCSGQPHWKVQNFSCSIVDWCLLHKINGLAALSALQSPWPFLLETPPLQIPKSLFWVMPLCTCVASHNRQRVHKLFPINIKASARTLCHYLVKRKWLWFAQVAQTAQKRREI